METIMTMAQFPEPFPKQYAFGFLEDSPLKLEYEHFKLSSYVPDFNSKSASQKELCHIPCPKNQCQTKVDQDEKVHVPLWKRRGAKPIEPLKFNPIICCEGWNQSTELLEPSLEIVTDLEWVIKKDHFEAHSIEDIEEGVVINPPVFPAWYKIEGTQKIVPAYLPYCNDILLNKAQMYGYDIKSLISTMGLVVADYSVLLMHPKRRATQEILILAGKEWQGAAAISAAIKLKSMNLKVSVYIHEGHFRTEEELVFLSFGGKVYRNINDIKARKFRVVIVGLENQHTSRSTILPLFGDVLQHAVAVFVDPPVLKGTYSSALQTACKGAYNISQKTVIFVPFLPKAYVVDDFVDVFVVDVGIIPEVYQACGMERFSFSRHSAHHQAVVSLVIPQKFQAKGSKIYFYTDGVPVC